jgi:hypothetical protein
VVAAAGSGRGGPWLLVADTDERRHLIWRGQIIGGDPVALSFAPDGRRLDVVVTSPTGPGRDLEWRLVRIDPWTGTRQETAVRGTIPGSGPVAVDASDDGETALVWTADGTAPVLVDLATGEQVPLRIRSRNGVEIPVVTAYRALATGAAQLWSDGTVTLYDRAGDAGQDLDAHELDLRQGPARDVVVARDRTWAAVVGSGATVVRYEVDPGSGIWSHPERLSGHRGDVSEVELDPERAVMVTLSRGDAMIVWDGGEGSPAASHGEGADPAVLLRRACAVVDRDLTQAEWSRYLADRSWQETCTDLA